MTPVERRKLIGILGRLGSNHDGERAAAGLLASRMLQSAGLTWAQLLEPPTAVRNLPSPCGWHLSASHCLQRPEALSAWEIDFLQGLPRFPRLSVKQQQILREIADRVLKGSGG